MTQPSALRNIAGLLTGAVLVLTLAPSAAFARRDAASAKRDPRGAANLYLLRNLEHTISTWKSPAASPAELGSWVFATRKRLDTLKTKAEAYKLDEDIIRAYGDMQQLLKEYERFLKDVVLHDLIANTARPEKASYTSLASGVTSGGLAGAEVGVTVGSVVPGFGNLVGAGAGALIGASAAAGSWISNYGDSVSKNERIDSQVKQTRVQLIDQLDRSFAATVATLKTRARILGGKEKYGWGAEVGFDGSERLSPEEQLRRRPRDSFLYAAIGIRTVSSNTTLAAEFLAKAADLVPLDFDAEVDIFDYDRAELLLMAARVAEHAAAAAGRRGSTQAAQAVKYYRAACACLKNGDKEWTTDVKLMYARACALSGQAREADSVIGKVMQHATAEQRPWLEFECAAVKSMLGDTTSALDLLRRSFKSKPRWCPYASRDPRFASLNASRPGEVERICANPLVGTWTGSGNLTLEFYPDGRMRQTINQDVKLGTYEEKGGGSIDLKTSGSTKPFKFTVSKTTLRLEGGGKVFQTTRVLPRLLGTWKYGTEDSFEFRDDGTWRRTLGTAATTGKYLVVSPKDGGDGEICFVRDNVVLGGVEKQVSFRFKSDVLEVCPRNEKTWYEYKRR